MKSRFIIKEAKKKKKPYDSFSVTTGDIDYNIRQFNKRMGTDFPGNDNNNPSTEEAKAQKAAEAAAKAAGTVSAASPDGGVAVDTSVATGEAGGESSVSEALTIDEDTTYVSRRNDMFEFPPQVKLLPQEQVEDFIKELGIEERFRVGYVTPVKLYTELSVYFKLFKATEITGYTGIDYRDAELASTDTHDKRVANAERQISDQDTLERDLLDTTVLHGRRMDPNAEFSTDYRLGAANKLGVNAVKPNSWQEQTGAATTKLHELNRILFYIDPADANIKNKYYLNFYNRDHDIWTGFAEVSREDAVSILFNEIVDYEANKYIERYILAVKDPSDQRYLKKLGLTPEEFWDKYHVTVSDYKYCVNKGIDPNEWVKEHPMSRRWSISDLKKSIHKALFAEDEATISSSDTTGQFGLDRYDYTDPGEDIYTKDKPNVRALYTNQVTYISGRPGTLGTPLKENLDINTNNLTEAKRYVRRYYIRPQNIFCSNKADILKALIEIDDANCSVYTLNNLGDEKDITKLTNKDIIYYYDDGILYDKNYVKVMDYDLFIKHEEERDSVDPERVSDEKFMDVYDDRMTDLTDTSDVKDTHGVGNNGHKSVAEDVDNVYDLAFESINVYGEKLTEAKEEICCICGEPIEGYGNNPEPYKSEGRCCDSCNMKFVIPARLEQMTKNNK